MVRRELPASVYRCKGIVRVAEEPDLRHVPQVVGRRTHVSPLDAWGERPRHSEIVAIDRDLDHGRLDELFDSCRA